LTILFTTTAEQREREREREEKDSFINICHTRIHLERKQNKYTNYKGIKNNTFCGQVTGIQEKLNTTCK
jgi:hypothetical protein